MPPDASTPSPAPPQERRRRWPLFLGLGLAVALIAAAVSLVAMRRELARSVIQSQLHALGLTDESHEVVDFGFARLSVRNVRLGADDLLADEVVFSYSMANLRAGVLDEVRIRGLRIRGGSSDRGLTLGALDALVTPDDDAETSAPGPIAMPILELVVEDFALTLATDDGDIDASGSVAARADDDGSIACEFAVTGTHPQLGPLHPVTAQGTATLRGTRVEFDVIARNDGGQLVAKLKGHHDRASGAGEAAIDTDPLQFELDGLQPATLAPSLADWIEVATGKVEARGTIAWSPEDGFRGGADLGFFDFSASSEQGSIDKLNAAIRVDGPWPPETPPKQLVSMAQIDFGLQLQNGLISFQLRPDGILDVSSAEWTLAGGKVKTRGRFDPSASRQSLVLDLVDLDLGELLTLVDLAGLTGEGTLTGRIPIELRGSTVTIRKGKLSATPAGGWIRYRPGLDMAGAAGQQQGFDVVLAALRNFRYDALSATIDGDTEGPVDLALHLSGANPDYLSGHPVEFNLNVEAHLVDLLRNATAVYRIPQRIEEKLAEISGGAP